MAALEYFGGSRTSLFGVARGAVAFLALGAADAAWFALTRRALYAPAARAAGMPPLRFRWPALAAYALVASALAVQVPTRAGDAAVYGALVGLVVYGAFNATTAGLLPGWGGAVAVADTTWGIVVCAGAAALTYAVSDWAGWYPRKINVS